MDNNNILEIKLWDLIVGYMYWETKQRAAVFEFDRDFIKLNPLLDISPLEMSVRSRRSLDNMPFIGNREKLYQGLPPVFADSLPDAWGSSLFNKWIASKHLNASGITPVDKLSYIGSRGMGALEFHPAHNIGRETSENINLQELYEFAQSVLSDRQTTNIRTDQNVLWQDLIKIGTSAGGRRPKAVIAFNKDLKEIKSGQTIVPEGYRHYILKFDEQISYPFTLVEFVYSKLAKKAGIEMTGCYLLENGNRTHFLTERFDRRNNEKIHIQTIAAMDTASDSYEDIFRTMRRLNLPAPEFSELFRRMVFNVVSGNADDHNKNFSFMMDRGGQWKLAPAYDLTFSEDLSAPAYMNRHEMSINGKNQNITFTDIEKIAKDNDIREYKELIDQVQDAVFQFKQEAQKYRIKDEIIRQIDHTIHSHEIKMTFGKQTKRKI